MLLLFLHSALGLFKEQELDVLRYYKPPYYPVDLRHIYYVGTIDNGTLDCNMNGAVKFHWWKISKEEISEGGFVFSWKEALKIPDPEKPWLIEIDSKNFQTNSAVILCRGINGYKADILAERGWIITRIHSPLGYPTEPTICGGEKYDCATLKPLFRIECMHDYGSEYAGSMSKTKSGTTVPAKPIELSSINIVSLVLV